MADSGEHVDRRRKPFTQRERKKWSQDYGHRYVNNWGSGDLPAPFCAGDIVELIEPMPDDDDGDNRLRGQKGPLFVVTYGPSVGEGDDWYFRVRDGSREGGSDRLHVFEGGAGINYMAPFRLVETVDPEGLAERERLLAAGWSYTPPEECPTCGQEVGRGVFSTAASGRGQS